MTGRDIGVWYFRQETEVVDSFYESDINVTRWLVFGYPDETQEWCGGRDIVDLGNLRGENGLVGNWRSSDESKPKGGWTNDKESKKTMEKKETEEEFITTGSLNTGIGRIERGSLWVGKSTETEDGHTSLRIEPEKEGVQGRKWTPIDCLVEDCVGHSVGFKLVGMTKADGRVRVNYWTW